MTKEKPGNILLVANFSSDTAYAWWLMEQFWKTLAEYFNQRGATAFLAYPSITSISDTIKNAPINTVELTLPWKTNEQKNQVFDFIKKNNISYLYYTDQANHSLQYAQLRFKGVKRIINHNHRTIDQPVINPVKALIKSIRGQLPWINVDRALYVSDLMLDWNLINERFPPTKCAVVQNGIAPLNCRDEKSSIVRSTLGISEDSVVVVSTGRAHPHKRFDFVIECAKRLHDSQTNNDMVFLLVGDGPAMEDLQNQINSSGLHDNVFLLGFRADVHDILCASDIAIHASMGEGFSLSILEYMSASLPVLVPDIESVNQAIRHEESGFIYPRDDIDAVVERMQQLATDGQLRLKMGSTARSDASTRYSLDNCLSQLISEAITGYNL